MSVKSGSRELLLIVASTLGLLIAFFTALYLRGYGDPMAQIAFKEKRVAIVHAMRLSLAAASEAQNSAVLSTGEQDSKTFADEARAASADLERGRNDLEQLIKERSRPNEVELMDRISQSLREFQKIDEQLLDLTSQSSNRKAFGLAFGPAMKLLKELDEPLSRIAADSADNPAGESVRLVRLAEEVRVGILRIQVLLLPHIAEVSEQKMDEFELEISTIDQLIRENLNTLKTLLPESAKSKIETVVSRHTEFENLKAQIITLSRQNTNVRATAIVLKEKRKAMLACQDALAALEHAILVEPVSSTIPAGRRP